MKLHIGCGKRYLKGWVNTDIKAGVADVVFDASKKFPYKNDSVDLIYCEHFIEHLTFPQGKSFFAESYRTLRKDGVIRVSTPNVKYVLKTYLEKGDCFWLNRAFYDWEHKFLYDTKTISDTMKIIGFSLRLCRRNASLLPDLRNLESRPDQEEIIIEGVK